jgi:hypothetical protein
MSDNGLHTICYKGMPFLSLAHIGMILVGFSLMIAACGGVFSQNVIKAIKLDENEEMSLKDI